MKLPDGREVDETLYLQRFTRRLTHPISIFPRVPCRFCLHPSDPADSTCNGCWEVTRRLEGFLQDGGEAAEKFVLDALGMVMTKFGPMTKREADRRTKDNDWEMPPSGCDDAWHYIDLQHSGECPVCGAKR